MFRHYLTALLIFFCAVLPAYAGQSDTVDTKRVSASLISDYDTVEPGQSFHIALRTELKDKWHTYWRNPGDSGEPVQISWQLPENIQAGEIIWPLPKPIPTGPIINYGFEDTPLFPVGFTMPADAKIGETITVTADFYYLVCKDVCIPESGSASLDISAGPAAVDARWDVEIRAAIAASPKTGKIKGTLRKNNAALIAEFTNLPEADFSESYFFPYDQGVIAHSEPQAVRIGDSGIQISTQPDFAWETTLPDTFKGVLTYQNGEQYVGEEVSLAVGQHLNVGLAPLKPKTMGGITLITAIFGALLGGLILNLMPCVFPIISLKALTLAKTAHSERGQARKDAWLYTAGVLVTFLILVGVMLALKAAGASLGWGFQLQSPKVTGVLALLMFAIGLNLLGVFEFGAQLQNTGNRLTTKSGASGSFFTGALAVIVATPCTAPFMAGAMGYALAQPAFITLVVFIAMAIGFAAPFLLLGYAPKLLTKLPKPGPWMVRFKEFLAFPMFATAIWLAWVMSNQAGTDGVSTLLIATLLLGFAIWLMRSGNLGKVLGALALLAAIALPISLQSGAQQPAPLASEAWSPQAVKDRLAEGRPVFVDFTADWCVTCKVNEKLVIKTDRTQKLFEDTDTAFLVADWTNKNDKIAQELEKYGRAGVPLYLVYRPNQNPVSADILPQVLTYDVIETAIRGE